MSSILVYAQYVFAVGVLLSVLALTTTTIREKYVGWSAFTATIEWWAGTVMPISFIGLVTICLLNAVVG